MHESDLTAIALKLADGTPIDWDALKFEAPEAHGRLLERFQQIEALARLGVAAVPEQDQLDSIRKARRSEEDTPLRWGHLEILEKVGRGLYGDVYKARDARLDRIVALKLLRSPVDCAQSDSEIIDEARLLARVRHPNVVTVYGAERIDGRVGEWMEYIDGRTLEEELAARGPFSAQDICEVGKALCSALTAVHEAGLFHRDIKAQNVMRDTRGRVVLADFGAGRDYSRLVDPSNIDEIAGTPAYLAPEVWEGAGASPQTEVYGLGVLLFRLATASFPVRGRTLGEIKGAHGRNSRTTCRDANTALPRPLVRIIDRAIEPDPAKRYQSAEALESALRALSGSSRAALAAVVHLVLFEATFIVAAIFVAAYVRFGNITWLLSEQDHGILKTLLIAGVMLGSLHYADLYDLYGVSDRRELFVRIVKTLGMGSIILAGIYFWFPELIVGPRVFLVAGAFVVTFVIGWRLLFDFLSRHVSVP